MGRCMFYCAIILIVLNVVSAGHYEGYKIYTIETTSPSEKDKLMLWAEVNGFDLLVVNDQIAAMVAPDLQAVFEKYLNEINVEWQIATDNVDKIIEAFDQKRGNRKKSKLVKGQYSFDDYHRHQQMNDYLDKLADSYPEYVTVKDEGFSYENRTIKSIRITDGTDSGNKVTMMIDCGAHAREWMSSTVCMYLIKQLTENRLQNIDMLKRVNWFIIPLTNPDGYEYSHTKKRLWVKTRRPDDTDPKCKGVDINRNFPTHWERDGFSDDPCSDSFRGRKSLSEPESRLLGDLIMAEAKKNPKKVGYLSFYSFGCRLQYSYPDRFLPPESHKLSIVSDQVVDAVRKHGTIYKVENSNNLRNSRGGGSVDYAKIRAKIELSFKIDLPPSDEDTGYSTFDAINKLFGILPPIETIKPICEETMTLVKEFAKFLADNY